MEIHRRLFLTGLGAASMMPFLNKFAFSQDQSDKLIKPPALNEGGTVGIVAPGTAVSDPDDLYRSKEALQHFGLKAEFAENLQKGSGYKTRTVKERLDDLHSMFKNDNINAVIAIRGGYGAGQLLDKIDYDLIIKNPKIFLGYSDITALHLAISKFAGLVTFHGPVLLSSFTNYTAENLRRILFYSEPPGILKNPEVTTGIRQKFPTRAVNPGKARGKLTGGNLSLICSLMGTNYEIDTKNKILFIEDISEQAYRIDRMLNQLRLAGKLNEAAGIIFGKCNDCDNTSTVWDPSVGEVADFYFKDLDCPALYGMTIGHTANQLTLPLGIEAELDADSGTLSVLESCVR